MEDKLKSILIAHGMYGIDELNETVLEILNLFSIGNRFVIRDYTCGELHEFDNYEAAKKKFDEIKKENDGYECDMQLYQILEDVDNVSGKM